MLAAPWVHIMRSNCTGRALVCMACLCASSNLQAMPCSMLCPLCCATSIPGAPQDFGARDPTAGELGSNFGEKVLGNYNTEHIIK